MFKIRARMRLLYRRWNIAGRLKKLDSSLSWLQILFVELEEKIGEIDKFKKHLSFAIRYEHKDRIKYCHKLKKDIKEGYITTSQFTEYVNTASSTLRKIAVKVDDKLKLINDLDESIIDKLKTIDNLAETFDRLERLADNAKKDYKKYIIDMNNAINSAMDCHSGAKRMASLETRITLLETPHGSGSETLSGRP